MRTLRAALTATLLTTLLALPTATAHATTHDAFTASVRVTGHGWCRISKSDAATRATLACRDGWRRTVRPCPQEDSPRCFWHAPTRGNGQGTSFVTLAGRYHYFTG